MEEPSFPVRLMVDKVQIKVGFAYLDDALSDILTSFLALPMSTIVRIKRGMSDSGSIGCLDSLYDGLLNLPSDCFSDMKKAKDMILFPMFEAKPSFCKTSSIESRISEDKMDYNTRVFRKLLEGIAQNGKTKPMISIITDQNCTPTEVFKLLTGLGVDDMSVLEERIVNVRLQEVLKLLNYSLSSKSPLTDTFLSQPRGSTKCRKLVEPRVCAHDRWIDQTITLKVMVKKSDKKILFVEAEEDFAELLFIFLNVQLQCAAKVRFCTLGSIDNINTSVWPYFRFGCDFYDHIRDSKSEKVFKRATFIVNDDLSIKPILSNSVVHLLGGRLSDIEEHVVHLKNEECLNVLEAALISKSALTTSLGHLIWKKT